MVLALATIINECFAAEICRGCLHCMEYCIATAPVIVSLYIMYLCFDVMITVGHRLQTVGYLARVCHVL